MDGPTHYRNAEALMDEARRKGRGTESEASYLAEAQVHATLAQAAAMAELMNVRGGYSLGTGGQYSQPHLGRNPDRTRAWSEAFDDSEGV